MRASTWRHRRATCLKEASRQSPQHRPWRRFCCGPLGMTGDAILLLERGASRAVQTKELARGALVKSSRLNVLLQTLSEDGYVTRQAEPRGKFWGAHRITTRGREACEAFLSRSVEVRCSVGHDLRRAVRFAKTIFLTEQTLIVH